MQCVAEDYHAPITRDNERHTKATTSEWYREQIASFGLSIRAP